MQVAIPPSIVAHYNSVDFRPWIKTILDFARFYSINGEIDKYINVDEQLWAPPFHSST